MNSEFILNLSDLPKELKLILDIISQKGEGTLVKNKIYNSIDLDWNLFLELAMHHRLYPVLYPEIKKFTDSFIPNFVIQKLSNLYKVNTFKMLVLCSEMNYISKYFMEKQIRCIFLKGPVLGKELYGSISLRTSNDIDILVPIEDLKKTEEILIKEGYVKDDYIKTVLNDWKWRHHHFEFFHPQKNHRLEVHWRLNPGPGNEPSFNEMWERKRKSEMGSVPIFYLGREDLFLFLVTHGSRHGWSRFRWLVDIHQIIRKEIDWVKLHILLEKYHYTHIGGQALILASNILNTEIPKKTKILFNGKRPRRLAQETLFYFQNMVNLHNPPLPNEVAIYHKRYLFSLMSTQSKILFLLSFLYPYPTDVEMLPLPKKFHFLYFPLRPFFIILRKKKNHALQ